MSLLDAGCDCSGLVEKDPSTSKGKRFLERGEKEFADLFREVADTGSWQPAWTSSGVAAYTKPHPDDGASCLPWSKGSGVLPASPLEIVKILFGIENKPMWDGGYVAKGQVLEKVDEYTQIQYQEYKPFWPTKARSFLTVAHWREYEDGSAAIVSSSLDLPHEDTTCVRGTTSGGAVLRPYSDPERPGEILTKAYLVSFADLKGNIPSMIGKVVARAQPMLIHNMRKAITKHSVQKLISTVPPKRVVATDVKRRRAMITWMSPEEQAEFKKELLTLKLPNGTYDYAAMLDRVDMVITMREQQEEMKAEEEKSN